ncbi:MAG: type VI secretion system tube protein Hcp, partial [Azoarcus sp.]|nr:type VI secretion system tube protein Hcp [Azoarcus sp.]
MAFDAFLKIEGIPGESKDSGHDGWIEILSYHHGVNQPASKTASSAGGATAERVNFGDFS